MYLLDRLLLNYTWRLLTAVFLLASAIAVGCSPSPLPPATTRPATPPPPSQESATPTPDAQAVTIVSGYVVGYVIGGGDTTPEGLVDAPRTFVYEIERDDGTVVYVTYTAYPPSPFGDSEGEKIRLDFHAGTVLIGDYLEAGGSYDRSANTLTVADEGDYIVTYPEKP